MYKYIRIVAVLFLALAWLMMPMPAFAIINPTNIAFGTGTTPLYRVFYNVLETGDMLFVAEQYVNYAVPPTDYTAAEAFLFEVLNTTGTVVLASRHIEQYGNKPISIYQTASQFTALGISVGDAIGLRITPNPLLFDGVNFGGGGAVEGTNQVTAYLSADKYIDQLLGVDNGVPTANLLRNFLVGMADNIEDNDVPANPYITQVQGYNYLTLDGGDIFSEGVPGLTNMCPILFQAGLEAMTSEAPESTGAYALTLTPAQQWGNTVANGLTNIGVYMGINQALAGSIMLFILAIMLAIYLYQRTESGISALLIMGTTPFLGAWLGLMPMALAFIFVIVIIVFGGYYFFSRGAL